jgi:diguanylate cyclase (GGDEF)-like protein
MQKELRYAADKLENLYERDPLTGVFNRRGLQHNKRVVAQAHQRGELVTVVAADVDNLKKVNDAYGHEGGDTIIIRSAMALTQAFPEDAVCVRTGGDEFCIYFSHDADASVEQMIQKVDHYLVDFNQHSGLPYQAGCSCGFCTGYVEDVSELDELQRIADENMYKVKLAKKAVRV